MALKRTLAKADYDKLPDAVKFEYKQDGESYVLDLEGYEGPAELKRAKDREAQKARDEKKRADDAEARVKELEGGDNDPVVKARKAGDIATLEKSWQTKLDEEKKTGAATAQKLRDSLTRRLVDGTAAEIAARISTTPAVLLPHIKARLQADFEGDEPITRVLGADGALSAMTVADLEKEFVANKDFAAIIVASKATGGGANGGRQQGGGATKKLSEMGDAERATFAKEHPVEFKKQVAEVQGTGVRI